jgi:predicted metal-dependent hydrolase
LVLRVAPGAAPEKKRSVLSEWYREQLKTAVPDVIAEWAPKIGVAVGKVYVRQMKTKWGSCNAQSCSIRLNTELAKKPRACVEYVVIHELVHLVEPTHNARFTGIMDRIMPNWRLRRDLLNELPVSHEDWSS